MVMLDQVSYGRFSAYRFSDGKSEAIIVPAVGRVLWYGLIGGANFLWNAPQGDTEITGWNGWGGDKTWLAPQTLWPLHFGRSFPPDPAWEGPQRVRTLSHGRLRLTGPVSSAGVRLVREFSFDAEGNFVITQTGTKVSGAPMLLALWSDTQIAPCDAVFLPISPESIFKGGICWMTRPKSEPAVEAVSSTVLQVSPEFFTTSSCFYKIGVDAPAASIAAVKDGVAFVQRAPRPVGDYAESAPGGGLAVQYFHHGHINPKVHYDELELLSPLQPFRIGSRWAHTVRWSLHRLPSSDARSAEVREAIGSLLQAGA